MAWASTRRGSSDALVAVHGLPAWPLPCPPRSDRGRRRNSGVRKVVNQINKSTRHANRQCCSTNLALAFFRGFYQGRLRTKGACRGGPLAVYALSRGATDYGTGFIGCAGRLSAPAYSAHLVCERQRPVLEQLQQQHCPHPQAVRRRAGKLLRGHEPRLRHRPQLGRADVGQHFVAQERRAAFEFQRRLARRGRSVQRRHTHARALHRRHHGQSAQR